jgi:hypothetical protein
MAAMIVSGATSLDKIPTFSLALDLDEAGH